MRIREVQLLGSKNDGGGVPAQQGNDSGASYNRQEATPSPLASITMIWQDDLPF
jgi:hypothetical protein